MLPKASKTIGCGSLTFDAFSMRPIVSDGSPDLLHIFCNKREKCTEEKAFQTENRFRSHTEIMRITKSEERELLDIKTTT